MGRKRSMQASLILMWAALLFHKLVVSEVDFDDQKFFFPPTPPVSYTPPAVSYTPPAASYTPPAASYTPPAGSYSSPPVPASHGGGSHASTPPAHCSSPPSGGGIHHPTPSPPTGGASGGYRRSPPTSTPTPRTPIISTPPSPFDPNSPPSPPSPFTPNSPPFTCTYWRNHPTLVWGVFGWWGTVGSAFSVSGTPGVGAQASLVQALSNTRTDGYGELYREGTAALLNSMAHTNFPYTTTHIKDSFAAALTSNKAASAQAQLFQLANEGRIKGREY